MNRSWAEPDFGKMSFLYTVLNEFIRFSTSSTAMTMLKDLRKNFKLPCKKSCQHVQINSSRPDYVTCKTESLQYKLCEVKVVYMEKILQYIIINLI